MAFTIQSEQRINPSTRKIIHVHQSPILNTDGWYITLNLAKSRLQILGARDLTENNNNL